MRRESKYLLITFEKVKGIHSLKDERYSLLKK